MIYEMRVYTLQPGKVAAFQELIEKEALPVISKYSKLVGCWSTEVGPLNEVIHITRPGFPWRHCPLGCSSSIAAPVVECIRIGHTGMNFDGRNGWVSDGVPPTCSRADE